MPPRSPAYERFAASMKIGYEQWHDGIGYALDALDGLSEEERRSVESLLIPRKNEDWRDAEALARLGTPKAIEALKESVKGPNREVRLRAAQLLGAMGQPADMDPLIVEGLLSGELGAGLAQAERLAQTHATPAVIAALLKGALCSRDGRAVRFAALLFFLHGKAKEPFEWKHRPFYLRFNTQDEKERRAVFDELCKTIGVDGSHIACG